MSSSMTKGNPLRVMLQFAFPLLVGNLLQQTYNIIDAAIVGQNLGAQALASVGASTSVQFMVLGFCMGSCTGFGIPVAKYFGAGDLAHMKKIIFNGAIVTAAIACIITALCALLCPRILQVLSVKSDIYDNAYSYLMIIFLGLPFTLLYNYLSSILRAVGDSRTPFLFLAFSAVLNIFLDLFFILVADWGCAGAAFATIAAQAISGILCLIVIIRRMEVLWLSKENRVVRGDSITELLQMGLPTGLQFSITAIGSVLLQSAVNALGPVCVAGNAAASKLFQLFCCPYDALAMTATSFTGQNLGAGKYDRIRQGTVACTLIGLCYCAMHVLLALFGTRFAIWIFMSAEEAQTVLAYTQQMCNYVAFFSPLLLLVNVFRLSIQGMGYSRAALCAGVMEMIARTTMSLWAVPHFGYTAACLAGPLAWLFADLFLVPAYFACLRARERQAAEARAIAAEE